MSLSLVLPPLPVPWQSKGVLPTIIIHNDRLETHPLIFSNSLDPSYSVHTTLIADDTVLRQEVKVMDGANHITFTLELLDNPYTFSRYKETFATPRELFRFSQGVGNGGVQTKEWIEARLPNSSNGSVYRWRFRSELALTLEVLSSGVVNIRNEQGHMLAQIQPFDYWTRIGKKGMGKVRVDAISPGEYMVSVRIQEPLEAYPLAIDPTISYGRWLGDGSSTQSTVNAIAVETDTGEIYVAGESDGAIAPAVTLVGTYNNISTGYVAEIVSANPPVVNWVHFLGGVGVNTAKALVVNDDEIYVGGDTSSSASWETAAFSMGTFTAAGTNQGYLVEIADGNPPSLTWRVWLGGNGGEELLALSINGDEVYAGGTSYDSNSWETFGSVIGTVSDGNGNGFVAEIEDGSPPTLSWLVWLGGSNAEGLNALSVNGDEIYAGGVTGSAGSWVTAASTLGSLTNSSLEGFVIEIVDGAPPSVAWRTWVGGRQIDAVYALAVNGDEVYAGGYTYSSGSWDTFGSTAGTLTNAFVTEGFVVEIADGGPPALNWRMWLGGISSDEIRSLAVNGEEIYALGYSDSISTWDTAGTLLGTFTPSGREGFIVEITDGGPPSLTWRVWVGSNGYNILSGLAVQGDAIYAGGYTTSSASMETFSTISAIKAYSANNAGFLVEIDDGAPPTYFWLQWLVGTGATQVNALAVNGDEIYTGGSSYGGTLGTFTEIGSKNGEIQEGFVIEVADAVTPSINWRAWLGGSLLSDVSALAVNGDEIYAAGSTSSSGSWETAGSVVGTMTNAVLSEGFVVEIADGSPPSLNWRVWLGGEGIDQVVALAINGDEIYAGGLAAASNSWETAGSTIGTFVGVDGFVVEIADGGPPSIAWRVWLGGASNDLIAGLAVDGDEIYAGGYGDSSDAWETVGSTIGTWTNTVYEAFVVEIADGAPPSLAWRIWLGGVDTDAVNALAINGDEVYAAGYSNSSDSWETVGSAVGTFVAIEGFVAEIADGAPPSIAWRNWVGGDSTDVITALVVNGDEIYAGGYSNYSASWDTFSSTQGTWTNLGVNEGFIVNLADGSPPTSMWSMWLGGEGDDNLKALVVNGNEVYAGGYIVSTYDNEGVYQGTKFDGQNSSFVLEISDDVAVSNEMYFLMDF